MRPAPARTVDPTVWREVGNPLVPGATTGPLAGETVAVKDVFAVAGHRTGAGVPAWLAQAPVATTHADAVSRLLHAGAAVGGIARTDQLAYSISGSNEHYGTPPNPAVPGGLPGGSTSGPAAAVALGEASIGLGTDTAGSIRVPASYQGLWGVRTTHGSVSTAGLVPLAPDFDTVGLLAGDPRRLRAAVQALVATGAHDPPGDPLPGRTHGRLLVAPALLTQAEPSALEAFQAGLRVLQDGGDGWDGWEVRALELPAADVVHEAFRVHQGFQAWQSHGEWISAHPGAVTGAAGERFAAASRITAEQDRVAVAALADLRAVIDGALQDGVLVLPSASSTAPVGTSSAADVDAVRTSTLRLTSIAGVTGRPAVSLPVLRVGPAPLGLCLVGARDGDVALVDLASEVAARLLRSEELASADATP